MAPMWRLDTHFATLCSSQAVIGFFSHIHFPFQLFHNCILNQFCFCISVRRCSIVGRQILIPRLPHSSVNKAKAVVFSECIDPKG